MMNRSIGRVLLAAPVIAAMVPGAAMSGRASGAGGDRSAAENPSVIAPSCAAEQPAVDHAATGAVTIRVSFPKDVREAPATGRLVVMSARKGSKVGEADPLDGPFWDEPQPMFGIDVKDLAPGASAVIDDGATSFPAPVSKLSPGTYRVQAMLDMKRENSSWRREEGNLFSSAIAELVVKEGEAASVDLVLDRAVKADALPVQAGVEFVEGRAELPSGVRGSGARPRAGGVLPRGVDAKRKYAAVYEVPGFGGDHRGVMGAANRRDRVPENQPFGELSRNAFWIVLDPESPNGHTLFADSANNGPCGRALVEELIPAIEAKYPLVPKPAARMLRGHSSGGWSTLWLALNYPETFGACWSSAPDPVDFHAMQAGDVYENANMYADGAGKDIPSHRSRGVSTMSVRQENLMEEVLGPDNTSGQQWDSWFAVWGPRDTGGHPAALFDPVTGVIDHAIAEQYKKYDIHELTRANEGTWGLTFHQRIRLLVGSLDSFYLNMAVERLKPTIDALHFFVYPEGKNGWIEIVPNADHGTVMGAPRARDIPKEMLDHLKRTKVLEE